MHQIQFKDTFLHDFNQFSLISSLFSATFYQFHLQLLKLLIHRTYFIKQPSESGSRKVWCLTRFSTGFQLYRGHWLLSHITIIETTDSDERGMNPVAMTIINPRKEYCPWIEQATSKVERSLDV